MVFVTEGALRYCKPVAKVPTNPFDTVEKTQRGRSEVKAEQPKPAKPPTAPPPAPTAAPVPTTAFRPPAAKAMPSHKSDVAAFNDSHASKPAPKPAAKPMSPYAALHAALEHGTYFLDDSEGEGTTGRALSNEFLAAVEEARRLLANVSGVVRVGPGRDEAQAPVILVVTSQGFSESAMNQVPESVKGFSTLITVPYTLLPLRRQR